MTKIYLAARYSRLRELQGYASDLRALGHEVTSRWIEGGHQLTDDEQREGVLYAVRGMEFAQHDLDDLLRATVCISFTEAPRSDASRGGRHVEFGIALARGHLCAVVGFRENVFHYLPHVRFFPTWEACLRMARELP